MANVHAPYGNSYYLFTKKGLSRELGFVAGYGKGNHTGHYLPPPDALGKIHGLAGELSGPEHPVLLIALAAFLVVQMAQERKEKPGK
jgi:hypothetical protein